MYFYRVINENLVLSNELTKVEPDVVDRKILFYSSHGIPGISNRNIWSNGKHPLASRVLISEVATMKSVVIAIFLVMSPIVINVPTEGLLLASQSLDSSILLSDGSLQYQKKFDVPVYLINNYSPKWR